MFGSSAASADCQTDPSGSFSSCRSNDNICKNIMYQSKCGALRRWASEAGGEKKWSINFRREIYWDSNCPVTMIDLKAIDGTMSHLKDTLSTNLVINCVANFFLGIFFPATMISNIIYGNSCFIPGTHDQEKLLIEGIEKYLGVAFHVIKLVPGIICLATFRLVSGPILDADANSCGDDVTTDRTFSELAEQVKECVLQLLCFQNH